MSKQPLDPAELVAHIKAQPGVNITRLLPGTKVLVETTQNVFEFEITHPSMNLVRVRGSDPRLRPGITGQLIHSAYDIEATIILPDWIGKGLRMHIAFKNATYVSTPILSARIDGLGWHYDVF